MVLSYSKQQGAGPGDQLETSGRGYAERRTWSACYKDRVSGV